jgi:hypothetical protein
MTGIHNRIVKKLKKRLFYSITLVHSLSLEHLSSSYNFCRVRVWHNFSQSFIQAAACSLFCTPHPVHCATFFFEANNSSNFILSLLSLSLSLSLFSVKKKVCDGNKSKRMPRMHKHCVLLPLRLHLMGTSSPFFNHLHARAHRGD